jgi:hypothetical protein
MNAKAKEELEIVKNGVRKYVPKLGEFIDLETPLLEYSQKVYQVEVEDKYLERQEGLKKNIQEQSLLLFGDKAQDFEFKLNGPLIANIVDHNGILNHPVLLSSHIVSSAAQLYNPSFDILSLNTAFYPFNSVFYDGGLTWKQERHRFISNSKSQQLVYYGQPIDFSRFPEEARLKLDQADSPTSSTAWQQAGRVNYHLWPQLFEKKLRSNLPSLITLNQDEIVIKLITSLIQQGNNFIHDIIFNSDLRAQCRKVFEGSTGAWDEVNNKGSFLFWGVDEQKRGIGLKLSNNKLISTVEKYPYQLSLTPEHVINALNTREIYPGMVLIFGAFVFYSGLVPLAGYGSVNYLNVMQELWLRLLPGKYAEECDSINRMVINKLIGGPVLTYYRDNNGELRQAYMLDVLMSSGLTKKYLDKIFTMSFGDLLLAPLIDIYNTYIPEKHRQPISITPADVVSEQLSWI